MRKKIVVVTGGAQGIGYAIAEKFAIAGDFVAIADLEGEKAIESADRLSGEARGYQLDVTDSGSISAFMKVLIEEWGRIDVLVNNAAAIETAGDGITVNAVLPGPVATELLMRQIHGLMDKRGISQEEALAEVMYPRQPMKRFIKPEEVANAVFFLASDQADAITGEEISVSGGM